MLQKNSSTILIVNDLDEAISNLLQTLPMHSSRIIRNEEKDDFLIAQANLAIKEAYISSHQTKYIILCGNTFRHEAQNALLKVLEEPPRNIVFVIITTSKSTILPTILSRMPHQYLKTSRMRSESELNFFKMDLKEVYQFLKEHQKINKTEAKILVESILFKINTQKIQLTQKELNAFSTSIKLIELNSKPINIITTLLLTITQRKHR